MRPLTIPIVLFALTATGYNNVSATEPKGAEAAETKYLTFQRMTGLHGYAGPRLLPGHFAPASGVGRVCPRRDQGDRSKGRRPDVPATSTRVMPVGTTAISRPLPVLLLFPDLPVRSIVQADTRFPAVSVDAAADVPNSRAQSGTVVSVDRAVAKAMLRTFRPGWTALAAAAAMACLLVGCTSLQDYVHNGFKVGPNYRKPPALVAPAWVDASDLRVRTNSQDLAAGGRSSTIPCSTASFSALIGKT